MTMKKIMTMSLFLLLGAISNAQCNTKVMESFGGTASVAMYNTYVSIGAIADGYVNESYDAERVKELMAEQVTMMTNLIAQMKDALAAEKSGLSADDRLYMNDMILCLGYLKDEAQGLQDYATDGAETSQQKYDTNRNLAWAKIEDLLGLGEEE